MLPDGVIGYPGVGGEQPPHSAQLQFLGIAERSQPPEGQHRPPQQVQGGVLFLAQLGDRQPPEELF